MKSHCWKKCCSCLTIVTHRAKRYELVGRRHFEIIHLKLMLFRIKISHTHVVKKEVKFIIEHIKKCFMLRFSVARLSNIFTICYVRM